jgi:hypothetical protein
MAETLRRLDNEATSWTSEWAARNFYALFDEEKQAGTRGGE